MTAQRSGSIFGLLQWQIRNVIFYVAAGTAAVGLYELGKAYGVEITVPVLPLSIVGGALGIFVSFRSNAAYDRWWEGRKLWGRLINTSRHWASQVAQYVRDPQKREEMIKRHIAYVHTLRCALRVQDPLKDPDCQAWLTDVEKEELPDQSNPTHYLLNRQLHDATALADAEQLDPFRLQSMDESVRHLLDIQGGCERIKKTPIPRGFAYIAEILIQYFSFLFPLAIVAHLSLWVVPINVLVCLALMLINEAGRVLEDPFTMFWNGLPLSNMSWTIEHNLRNRLGEPERSLNPIPGPDENGILM